LVCGSHSAGGLLILVRPPLFASLLGRLPTVQVLAPSVALAEDEIAAEAERYASGFVYLPMGQNGSHQFQHRAWIVPMLSLGGSCALCRLRLPVAEHSDSSVLCTKRGSPLVRDKPIDTIVDV